MELSPDQELEELLRGTLTGTPENNEAVARDKGRDTAEEATEEPVEAQEAQEEPVTEEDTPDTEEAAEEPPEPTEEEIVFQAPEHWSEADKQFLDQFEEPEVKQHLVDWRKQIERAADDKFQKASEGLRLQESLKDVNEYFKQGGHEPVQAIRNLAQLDAAYRENPMGTVAHLIQEGMRSEQGRSFAGSDQARQFVQQIAATMGVKSLEDNFDEYLDPAVGRELKQLRQEVAEYRRSQQQSQPQRQPTEAEHQIEEFARTHDRFEEARPLMATLMQQGKAGTLDEAYELAMKVLTPQEVQTQLARPQGKLIRRRSTPASGSGNGLGSTKQTYESFEEGLAAEMKRLGSVSVI